MWRSGFFTSRRALIGPNLASTAPRQRHEYSSRACGLHGRWRALYSIHRLHAIGSASLMRVRPFCRCGFLAIRVCFNASTVSCTLRISFRYVTSVLCTVGFPRCCSSDSYADSSVFLTLVPLFYADSLFLWSRSRVPAPGSHRV